MTSSFRRRVFDLLEADDRRRLHAFSIDGLIVLLVIANMTAVALETVEPIRAEWEAELLWFDAFCVTVFIIEYAARLWVCTEHLPLSREGPWRARLRFAASPMMVIDLVAILPTLLIPVFGPDFLFIRILRLIRLLKLARYSPALVTLWRVLFLERRALVAALIIMSGLIVFAASLLYLVERHAQPVAFGSIPAAMWWALATLTTVGYGDVVPVTVLGKVFAGMMAILGIGMFALPIGIIASGFANEVHRRDFVVTWSMVARVPLFSRLDASAIARIAGLLHSRTVPVGFIVMRRGERAETMYFVLDGQIDIDLQGRRIALDPGDFFGEIALLHETRRSATAIARTTCKLMELDAVEFHRLLDAHPEIHREVTRVADERLSEGRLDRGDVADEELRQASD